MVQVLPNAEDEPEELQVQLWMGVDHENGLSAIDDVFWKVYHPDGEFKVQVHGTRIGADNTTRIAECAALGSANATGTMFEAAVHTGQISANAVDDINLGLVAKCQENEKAIYYAKFDISKHQPCGEYRVEAYAVSSGAQAMLTNYIDVICFYSLEIDFDDIDWGQIVPGSNKVVSGDLIFDPSGFSDEPTVKNTGNHGMGISVKFWELVQQDVDGPKLIQDFDACFGRSPSTIQCLGEDPSDPIHADPMATAMFDDDPARVLCANEVGKLDLSIHPPNTIPLGEYDGRVEVIARMVHNVCTTDQEHIGE
jgi:hypothetical protein